MRDKNLSFIQFCNEVDSFLNRKLLLPRLLRTTVINSPTFPDTLYIRYPRKYRDLMGLVAVHWYLPDNLKWEIHLGIWSMTLSHFNEKQKVELNLMIQSKEMTLKYLYLTRKYSSNEIFGNILGTGLKVLKDLTILPCCTKVQKAIRKRGYDDKGSLRPEVKWLPTHDYYFTLEQNEKEKNITKRNKLIDRLTKIINENDLTV